MQRLVSQTWIVNEQFSSYTPISPLEIFLRISDASRVSLRYGFSLLKGTTIITLDSQNTKIRNLVAKIRYQLESKEPFWQNC